MFIDRYNSKNLRHEALKIVTLLSSRQTQDMSVFKSKSKTNNFTYLAFF